MNKFRLKKIEKLETYYECSSCQEKYTQWHIDNNFINSFDFCKRCSDKELWYQIYENITKIYPNVKIITNDNYSVYELDRFYAILSDLTNIKNLNKEIKTLRDEILFISKKIEFYSSYKKKFFEGEE